MRNTDGMICAIKSDLFKLKKHKSVWIGSILMFALILIAFGTYWLGLDLLTKIEFEEDIDSIIAGQEFILLARYHLFNFSEICGLTLFIAIITCLFIGKEFSNGAMRLCVSRGANRVHLYFSKLICIFLLVIVYSVAAIIICGIFTAIKGYGIPFDARQFGLIVRSFALHTLCNLSTASAVVMIAFLCRSSGASLGATIGISIIITIISELVLGLLPISGNPDWMYFMPLQQNSIAGKMTDYSTAQLCAVIIMPIVYGAIATLIGLYTFLKRDIR